MKETRYTLADYLNNHWFDTMAPFVKAQPFISVTCIVPTIEAVGDLFDHLASDTKGQSEKRFIRGFKKLFTGKEYGKHKYQKDFYEQLRCPFTHLGRPGNFILSDNAPHLSEQNGRTTINVLTFFADLKSGWEKLDAKINSGALKGNVYKDKVEQEILIFTEADPVAPSGSSSWVDPTRNSYCPPHPWNTSSTYKGPS